MNVARCSALLVLAVAAAAAEAEPIPPAVPIVAHLFPLGDVQILAGPCKTAMEMDRAYLLKLDPDKLLYYVRQNAGLAPKSPTHYGGWDAGGAGIIGHYLSACAQMSQADHDPQLRQRVAHIVSELAKCQEARGDGGLFGFRWDAEVYFPRMKRGQVLHTNVTAWYGIHKIMAGLRDAYVCCGNEQARQVLIRQCDWAIDVTANLTDAQWQQMLSGEHGAPQEILADVYAMTGQAKYLQLAEKFRHNAVFDPLLSGNASVLNGLHANTNIPKFVGYERIYEMTGQLAWHTAAQNFWNDVVEHRTWVIGGNSQWESFFPERDFEKKVTEICGPETCNTYNMLKLTRQLFELDPRDRYIEYYERALYNHILSSEDTSGGGGFAYYTSMRPGHYRVFSDDYNAFWCCVGTGMENHAEYGAMVYAHGGADGRDDTLWINLFMPTELQWADKGLTLRAQTRFPDDDTIRYTFLLHEPILLKVKLRYPTWVQAGKLSAMVNDEPVDLHGARPGEYVSIDRQWKPGDVLRVHVPMTVHPEPLPDSSDYVALLDGPIVLAGELGTQGLTPANFHHGPEDSAQLATHAIPLSSVPMLVGDPSQAALRLQPVEGQPLTFTTGDLFRPHAVTLEPFYKIGDQRYAIYWRTATPEMYATVQKQQIDQEKEQFELASRTVDQVRIGEQQPEADHDLDSDRSNVGAMAYPFPYSHWRDARGFFSYRLTTASGPLAVRCVYWGSDKGREFDILVDGARIATERLTAKSPGQYISEQYPIPARLTQGKRSIVVRFQAHPGSDAGGVFDLRLVRES